MLRVVLSRVRVPKPIAHSSGRLCQHIGGCSCIVCRYTQNESKIGLLYTMILCNDPLPRLTFRYCMSEYDPCLPTTVEEVVTEQDGMLLLIPSQHVKELLEKRNIVRLVDHDTFNISIHTSEVVHMSQAPEKVIASGR